MRCVLAGIRETGQLTPGTGFTAVSGGKNIRVTDLITLYLTAQQLTFTLYYCLMSREGHELNENGALFNAKIPTFSLYSQINHKSL